MSDEIEVEVALALPEEQFLVAVKLPAGATVAMAIEAAQFDAGASDYDVTNVPAGIWGRVVERGTRVQHGDRVEIYRPLELDPREARRQLASLGRTMREG